MKIVLTIAGILLAAVGGMIAYRAFFVEPDAAIVITNSGVREVPNLARAVGGLVLLVCGAALAFFAAPRR